MVGHGGCGAVGRGKGDAHNRLQTKTVAGQHRPEHSHSELQGDTLPVSPCSCRRQTERAFVGTSHYTQRGAYIVLQQLQRRTRCAAHWAEEQPQLGLQSLGAYGILQQLQRRARYAAHPKWAEKQPQT